MIRIDELRSRAATVITERLRTAAGGRWGVRPGPRTIAILLTERCNARCVHCDIWKNRGKESSPSVTEWTTALDGIREWLGPVHVVFTGGEALLMPFGAEVVAHACAIGLLVEHLTHGYWVDQTRIEQMALANPWRVTVSCDGIGAAHDAIRGREGFFERTKHTIQTLLRLRREHRLRYTIRLKTVVMAQNLDQLRGLVDFAAEHESEIFFQPVEQNYNTPDDPRWFEHSPTWPADPDIATAAVGDLLDLKRQGLPIANSIEQLEVMIPYFRNPASLLVVTQGHIAHRDALCAGLTDMQIQSNGDVKTCWCMDAVGNIKAQPLRQIWLERPRWWESGCCMDRRMADVEKVAVGLA